MPKDLKADHRKVCSAKSDSDETPFRLFLIASFVSLALLTLFVGLVAR